MTECCDDYGNCTRGNECPARPAMYDMPASLARAANERIRRLEASNKPPLHIRAWDWLFNLPHRFGRWVDRTNPGHLFCLSVGWVAAGALAVLVVMR